MVIRSHRSYLRGIKPYRSRITLKVIRVIRIICEICGLNPPNSINTGPNLIFLEPLFCHQKGGSKTLHTRRLVSISLSLTRILWT